LLEWPLAKDGKIYLVPMDGRVMVNDAHLAVRLTNSSVARENKSRSRC
jgi:hypothetical protein